MSEGFSEEKLEVAINKDEVDKLLKQYKKIKKYMKSSLYTIKTLDGNEKIVNDLLKELEDESDGKALST
jgi:DNA-binding ferritin-like protein (Dps family)